MPTDPGQPTEPPPPPIGPDPPAMPVRDLVTVLARLTDCPYEVADATALVRAWLLALPETMAI